MGPAEPLSLNQIVRLTCSTCRINTIYIKVNNYQSNNAPFKANDYICTECNQGMMQNVLKKE